jgi:ketosteroid isomerase-like protein
MSAEQNRQLVLKFYEHMSNLEFDKMFDLMAEDATWTVAGNPETFHHAGTMTKAQRVEGFSHFMAFFKGMKQEVISSTAEDDRVCIEARSTCWAHNGMVYKNEPLLLLRCRDGKIVHIYEHLDQLTTLAFEKALAEAQQPA